MSSSQHPIALRIERRVGGATRLLATVMSLPLVDGIFPALVLAGALADPIGVLELGLLVFGGSATVAVVLAEMEGSPAERSRVILGVGIPLILLAVIETALAPTIASVLDLAVFERFAALVLFGVAAATASSRVADVLPRPAVIIGFGVLASVEPAGAQLVTTLDPGLLVRGGAAAGIGVGFALAIAQAGPYLEGIVDLDRFRFGSAVALGVLGLSVLGVLPTDAPLALAVLGVTALLALDPGQSEPADVDDADDANADDPATRSASETGVEGLASLPSLGDTSRRSSSEEREAASEADQADRRVQSGEGGEDRVPWL